MEPTLSNLIRVNKRLDELTVELDNAISYNNKNFSKISMINNQIELAKYVRRQYLSQLMEN